MSFVMDIPSEQRLNQVHPRIGEKIRALAEQLSAQGIYIRVIQGLRTVAEQDALYAQGRSTPGNIVTNCPGGHSYHNYGLAVDCAPSTHGPGMPYDPDWNESHPVWARMEHAGSVLGLDSGAFWRSIHDAPHFQLTGVLPEGHPPESALLAFQKNGLQAVWDLAQIDHPAPA